MLNGENCARCREYTKFEELTYGADAYGICPKCVNEVEVRKEKVRVCLEDGKPMEKHFFSSYRVIIDKCPKCGGIWLENRDVQELKKILEEQDAERRALMLGFVMGSL